MNLFEDFKLSDITVAKPPYKNGDVVSVNDDGSITVYKTATPGPTGPFNPQYQKQLIDLISSVNPNNNVIDKA